MTGHDDGATLVASIAAAVRAARTERALSVVQLADSSGVSRAMIGKIERGDVQPTAALLGRLSAALGYTLSQLVARAENDRERFRPRRAQQVWTDPETGYVRHAVTAAGAPIEIVDVTLPGGTGVSYPAEAYFRHHVLWVLVGRLDVLEGSQQHRLRAGDSLALGVPAPCTYRNPTTRSTRYAVVLTPRS